MTALQVRTCRVGLWLLRWSGVLGAFPTPPPVPPGGCRLDDLVNPFGQEWGPLNFGSRSPTPRRRRSPSPASLSPFAPFESVLVGMTPGVLRGGKEDTDLPFPRTRVLGDPAPRTRPPGPLPPPFLRGAFGCTSPRPAAEVRGPLLLPRPFFPGAPIRRRLLVNF
ncbi:hypothetical protein GWK47_028101 [Chionoecetes opilio]|uniref:Uncharacterized protein n=1 Tax=Chionoecetes opilio TaxID=41210 RepID=A0A8J4YPN0_CHIOP|nr:hypothetical protein GWK47_028101 [Chionoecetes opilio]